MEEHGVGELTFGKENITGQRGPEDAWGWCRASHHRSRDPARDPASSGSALGLPEQSRATAGAQVQLGVQTRKQIHRGYGTTVKQGVWSPWQTPSTALLLQHD